MELAELIRRRKALANKMTSNSVAILSSANRNFRTRDVENPFRQESDFLYLTGISEPNLLFVMFEKDNELHSILFRDNTSEKEKIWDGERLDNSEILDSFGFTAVFNYKNYIEKLWRIL